MSLDGHIDDAGPERLRLSNDDDFDEIDEERAASDAILVGAGTLRADNPRLLVRSAERRRRRASGGATEHPTKVVLTASGKLDPTARFFTTGDAAKLVYADSGGHALAAGALHGIPDAAVVDAGSRSIPRSSSPTWRSAACADCWSKAGAGCTPSSSPPGSPTSCASRWHRS